MELTVSYDLGTSGTKATVFGADGKVLNETLVTYPTYYPERNVHVQRPDDWWAAVRKSTQALFGHPGREFQIQDVRVISLSGQSLAAVPIDRDGKCLTEYIPIWSDTSSQAQADAYFLRVDRDDWYLKTGNGFAEACYTIFKIMNLRESQGDLYRRVWRFLGSKDYINFLLTGEIATDFSYASGLGAYDLIQNRYDDGLLEMAGIDRKLLPEVVASTSIVGTVRPGVARELGFPADVRVVCGGVDNACMALGAGVFQPGTQYLSLGSSAWIAVATPAPIVEQTIRPFVFSHVVPGSYTSATAIFSAGSTLRWLRDTVCGELVAAAQKDKLDEYDRIVASGLTSPIGANGLVFNPSLGGVPASYHIPHARGGLFGLSLGHDLEDIIRSVLEGICLDLFFAYERLSGVAELSDEMIFVGGGSKNQAWTQMFADVFGMNFVTALIGQNAASFGAAAIAAVGMGWWENFEPVWHEMRSGPVTESRSAVSVQYNTVKQLYRATWQAQTNLGTSLG